MISFETLRKKEFQELKPRTFIGQNDTINRKVIDEKLIDILVDPHTSSRRDTLKKLDTGLNEVMARAAAQRNVRLGINIENMRSLSPLSQGHHLARVMHNIEIARKAGMKLAIKGTEVSDVLISWGASTEQASQAQSF